jgi:pilus assembly protein TadC
MNLLRRGLKGLPRGVPQIIGALLALPILLLLAALHIRVGPVGFAVNWTTFLTFVLVGMIIFVVARASRRPRG